MPSHVLRQAIDAFAALGPEDAEAVEQQMREKDTLRRFELSIVILRQMLNEGPALVQGDSEQRSRDWAVCVDSVTHLWNASATLWRGQYYAPATALAISTLEETGKLAVERFRLLGSAQIHVTEDGQARLSGVWKPRRTPFRDHFSKTVMAAMAGALVNARADRILGLDFVNDVLERVESQRLEALRQSCLYLDRTADGPSNPMRSVSREDAARYVALSGEVLAEVLPNPSEWEAALDRVAEFEREAGLPHE
jgi:AbiV family abortive infection protein